MQDSLQDQFDTEKDTLDYYDNWFSRSGVEKLAEVNSIDLDKNSVRDDVETLSENDVLEDFHRYVAALDGIGPNTIIQGIKTINRDKMQVLSTDDMESKSALLLYLYEWEWEDHLDLIQALKTFKNKRTYQREEISGEKIFDELGEDEVEQLRRTLQENIDEANNKRKYKAELKSVHLIDENEVMAEIYVEYKSGHYRQFKFREEDNKDYDSENGREVEAQKYWPITTRYIHVDYDNNEYDHNIQRSKEDFLKPVITTLYSDVEYGEDVKFIDPIDYPDKTPTEFVEDKVEEQKEKIENDDSLDDDEKEDYIDVLDNLSAAEQTALTLENVNVAGDLIRIEIETGEPIESFAEGNNLESQLSKFNKESQRREYTLTIGDQEIQVKGVKIEILGDVSKEEEEMITEVLRDQGEEDEMEATA
ncbi:hypothetical protein HSB1_47310 [Halogranum salarium B-1]|uniref:Uncharacterized protein n=2 Tax=Halogranum rubrum TaxID=553466 RepID=J3JCU4_9EURY|nr:hypothetical protein HSB1_47310 [Halogranum salarium B-1]